MEKVIRIKKDPFPLLDKNKIYDILIEECKASSEDYMRDMFLHSFPECEEYRFQGNLGFGGKIWWRDYDKRMDVTCYREDETPERLEIIQRVNKKLKELLK